MDSKEEKRIPEETVNMYKERDFMDNLGIIHSKDQEFFNAISDVVKHLSATYSDKYEHDEDTPIVTKKMLLSKDKGGIINTYQAAKYLQRYIADSKHEKASNVKDLYKIIHYLTFEIQRRKKIGNVKDIDSKN